jgi:hypothetical protein
VGGIPFTHGPLAYLLKNRTYLGETGHNGAGCVGCGHLEATVLQALRQKFEALGENNGLTTADLVEHKVARVELDAKHVVITVKSAGGNISETIEVPWSPRKTRELAQISGHKMELVWDVHYADVPSDGKSPLLNRPSKRPTHGVPVRRLDHVNLLCSNVTKNKNAFIEQLGFRLSEHIITGDGSELGAWIRTTALAHDVALMQDATGARGRLHHVCYWYQAESQNPLTPRTSSTHDPERTVGMEAPMSPKFVQAVTPFRTCL